jgi:formylglycine-generating enzyme required for sulfatase activity
MTYGGNEEILKGGKGARRSPRAGKDGQVTEEKMFMATIIRNSLPEYRLPTEAEWNICGSS